MQIESNRSANEIEDRTLLCSDLVRRSESRRMKTVATSSASFCRQQPSTTVVDNVGVSQWRFFSEEPPRLRQPRSPSRRGPPRFEVPEAGRRLTRPPTTSSLPTWPPMTTEHGGSRGETQSPTLGQWRTQRFHRARMADLSAR